MKKSLLPLALVFLFSVSMPGVPDARAAQDKAKAGVKTGQVKKAGSGTAKATAGQNRKKATAVAAKPVMTPLRAMHVAYDKSWPLDELGLRSAAALVLDQRTGEALYAKNVDVPTSIASITKLMTAMVTLDAGLPLGDEIVINEEDIDRIKGTGSRLPMGTRLTREELLNLALIASENRAASALTRAYPGGRVAFVAAMNRKAREIGMKDAHFVDGTGLHSGNRATAADLARMVDAAYRYPLIRRVSTTGSYDVSVPGTKVVKVKQNGKIRKISTPIERHVAFNNTNSLTRDQDWDIGVSKTGYINEAGHCLVMQTRIAEQKVIIVLLDAHGKWSRIGDANRIRDWLEHGGEPAEIGNDHRNSV